MHCITCIVPVVRKYIVLILTITKTIYITYYINDSCKYIFSESQYFRYDTTLAEGVMSEDDTQQAGVFHKKISQICRSIPRGDLCIGQFW